MISMSKRADIYIYIHMYIRACILWICKCVIKTVGCGTSHKYTNIQIYGVKYYKHFAKTVESLCM